jgi:hypothetical protein
MRDFRNPREPKALTRTRRVKVRVTRLVALLGISGAGLVYREAIAQEVTGQYRWRMATGPTVLTVEQEKAMAGKPGSDFKECANGCPVMIVVPAGNFIMGSPEKESPAGKTVNARSTR